MIPTNVSFTADLRPEISVSSKETVLIHHLSDYVRASERKGGSSIADSGFRREGDGEKNHKK